MERGRPGSAIMTVSVCAGAVHAGTKGRARHARATDHRRRARPGGGDRGALASTLGAALHSAQGAQSPGPRPQAIARGDQGGLHRHDVCRRPRRGGRQAPWLPRQVAAQMPGRRRGASRRPASACSPSRPIPTSNGSRCEPPMPPSGCTSSSSGGSKRSASCPPPKPPACCSGPCWPAGRSPCDESRWMDNFANGGNTN